MTVAWTAETTPEAAARRAGGRRRYNASRKFLVANRRMELSRLLSAQGSLFERGTQARMARKLGVSRATICRDIEYLLRLGRPCPHCGAYIMPPTPLVEDDREEDEEAPAALPYQRGLSELPDEETAHDD
jgi:predicted DNA-binding transcriptional regulator YafY